VALKPAGRALSSLTGVVVMAAVLWALLNFVYAPSCGRFDCSYVPSWWPAAAADSGSCPESISGAMNDAGWAADRLAEIADERRTTGIFFDEEGMRHEFDSGDESGDDAQRARRMLAEVGATAAPDGSYPAASHVEVKVAALMRESGVRTGVLVINKEGGPCAGTVGLSCQEVLPRLLSSGAWLRVWHPPQKGSGIEFSDFRGR
jgi:hypothetical protein